MPLWRFYAGRLHRIYLTAWIVTLPSYLFYFGFFRADDGHFKKAMSAMLCCLSFDAHLTVWPSLAMGPCNRRQAPTPDPPDLASWCNGHGVSVA